MHEHDAQVEVAVGVTRVQGDGLAEQRHGSLLAARASRQQAQQMVGGGMSGVGLENLPAKRFRPFQIATLLTPQGRFKKFTNRRHAQHRSQSSNPHEAPQLRPQLRERLSKCGGLSRTLNQ